MSASADIGKILEGNPEVVQRAYGALARQEVDLDLTDQPGEPLPARQTTLASAISVTGPGTFLRRAQRTLTFAPAPDSAGWWIDRRDLTGSLPIRVSIENVWTTGAVVSNIVLRSGSPHNYLRMVEHIVALKVGLGLDHVLVCSDSGDPPLFERGSLDLVEAIERAGIVTLDAPAVYWSVKEPVTLAGPAGNLLTIHPAEGNNRRLTIDCAVDFPNAIGRQRIRFVVNRELTRLGSIARTNTSLWKMIYCRTIGKIFADVRNLGYSQHNVVIAGPRRYFNEPRLFHEGKSLEAAWHRAVLDLLAAVALIGDGRLAGRIVSYKAGHVLDCRMISRLYRDKLLERLP